MFLLHFGKSDKNGTDVITKALIKSVGFSSEYIKSITYVNCYNFVCVCVFLTDIIFFRRELPRMHNLAYKLNFSGFYMQKINKSYCYTLCGDFLPTFK